MPDTSASEFSGPNIFTAVRDQLGIAVVSRGGRGSTAADQAQLEHGGVLLRRSDHHCFQPARRRHSQDGEYGEPGATLSLLHVEGPDGTINVVSANSVFASPIASCQDFPGTPCSRPASVQCLLYNRANRPGLKGRPPMADATEHNVRLNFLRSCWMAAGALSFYLSLSFFCLSQQWPVKLPNAIIEKGDATPNGAALYALVACLPLFAAELALGWRYRTTSRGHSWKRRLPVPQIGRAHV